MGEILTETAGSALLQVVKAWRVLVGQCPDFSGLFATV